MRGVSAYAVATAGSGGAVVCAGGSDGHIRVWDTRAGADAVAVMRGARGAVVRGLALDAAGTRVLSAGSEGGVVREWALGERFECVRALQVEEHGVQSIWALHSRDDSLSSVLTASRGGVVAETDVEAGTSRVVGRGASAVTCLMDEPARGRVWVGSVANEVMAFDLAEGGARDGGVEPVVSIAGHRAVVQAELLDNRHQVLVRHSDETLALWDVPSCRVLREWAAAEADVPAVLRALNDEAAVPVSVAKWFSYDHRLGHLALFFESPNVFSTEVFVDDIGLADAPRRADHKVNSGCNMVVAMFRHFSFYQRRMLAREKAVAREKIEAHRLKTDGAPPPAPAAAAAAPAEATPKKHKTPEDETPPRFSFPVPTTLMLLVSDAATGEVLLRKRINEFDGTEYPVPTWCYNAAVLNKIPFNPAWELDFFLLPAEGEALAAPHGKKDLRSMRIIRADKVLEHVVARLELVLPEGKSAADVLELLCKGRVVPGAMSLVAIKTHVWKSSQPLRLEFRRREEFAQLPLSAFKTKPVEKPAPEAGGLEESSGKAGAEGAEPVDTQQQKRAPDVESVVQEGNVATEPVGQEGTAVDAEPAAEEAAAAEPAAEEAASAEPAAEEAAAAEPVAEEAAAAEPVAPEDTAAAKPAAQQNTNAAAETEADSDAPPMSDQVPPRDESGL